MNELVKSDAFAAPIDGGASVMENYVDQILNSTMSIEFEAILQEEDFPAMSTDVLPSTSDRPLLPLKEMDE